MRELKQRRLVAIAAAYVATRIVLMVVAKGGPIGHPDTPSFRAGVSLLGGAPRPWPVPLGLRAFGDWGYVVLATIISAVAFLVLAYTLAEQMRDRRVGCAIAALVLLTGLSPRVTTWDRILTSESLAVSLTAFLIVVLVRLGRVPSWVAVAVFGLWVFVRDGHLYVGVAVVVGVCVWGWRQRQWAIPVGFVLTFVWCGLASANDRYIEGFNVVANYAGRLAYDDPDDYRWFAERGAPVTKNLFVDNRTMQTRIRLMYVHDEFREWAEHDGVTAMAEYIVTHPRYALRGLEHIFLDDNSTQAPSDRSLVDHAGVPPNVGNPPGPPVWPQEAGVIAFVLLVSALCSAWYSSRRVGLDRRWIIPVAVVATTPTHAMLAWHSSPYEIGRHGLVMAFGLWVATAWMVALGVDVFLTSRLDAVRGGDPGDEVRPLAVGGDVAVIDAEERDRPVVVVGGG